jgi:hypothetical protein
MNDTKCVKGNRCSVCREVERTRPVVRNSPFLHVYVRPTPPPPVTPAS